MKPLTHFILLLSSLSLIGCGGDATEDVTMPPPPAAPAVADMAPPAAAPSVTTPPGDAAPATMEAAPDPFESVKISQDGSPNKTDLEALQALVDAYAFGVDGLGAPAIPNLEALVAKGFLKRIPAPPDGKKWAYDSAKWKVSLVDK
jgi:hypothetical protein